MPVELSYANVLKRNVNDQYLLDMFIRDYDEFTSIKGNSEGWCHFLRKETLIISCFSILENK